MDGTGTTGMTMTTTMDAVPMATDILDGLASVCICETDIIQRSILRFICQ
jgi:hypothetical protein